MECWLNTARLYADAIQSFSKLTAPDPHAPHLHTFLAASLAQLGNSTAAAAHAREVLQREPAFTAEGFTSTINNIRTQSTCVTGSSKPAYRTDSIDDFSGGWRLLPWYTGIVPKYNIRLAVEVILCAS
jgi:hypothetical protein